MEIEMYRFFHDLSGREIIGSPEDFAGTIDADLYAVFDYCDMADDGMTVFMGEWSIEPYNA